MLSGRSILIMSKPKNKDFPGVVVKTEDEFNTIIMAVRHGILPEEMRESIEKCVRLSSWLPSCLQRKNISIARFREIIFGKAERKPRNPPIAKGDQSSASVENNYPATSTGADPGSAEPTQPENIESLNTIEKTKKSGHGRMPHTVYDEVSTKILVSTGLKLGDPCPQGCGGRLGELDPGHIIIIKGQNFACVHDYVIEKLRCNLCRDLVSATPPPEAMGEKYDESFKAMLAINKYYVAVPFYRQENFQRMLGLPLPDATQWDQIEKLASCCYAVFNLLKGLAANGNLIQNDDTRVRILEVMKLIKDGLAGDRKGMQTTGIIAEHEGNPIALFINGRQHSGENLRDLLQLRSPEKGPIIQMCDALSANVPGEMKTILCNCLAHGFRKFEELVDFFEEECLVIIKMLSTVFEHDQQTRGMSFEDRLAFHKKHSKPIMDELKVYMDSLISDRKIEPVSELGKAIKYMNNHWEKLTKFLTMSGAPIDNNIVERALKIAIRNRKAAMFFKTTYSAGIAGMITSLIYTADLCGQNPHHYLVALQVHKKKVEKNPALWMPWNYLETMKAIDANSQGHSPPQDLPVAA